MIESRSPRPRRVGRSLDWRWEGAIEITDAGSPSEVLQPEGTVTATGDAGPLEVERLETEVGPSLVASVPEAMDPVTVVWHDAELGPVCSGNPCPLTALPPGRRHLQLIVEGGGETRWSKQTLWVSGPTQVEIEE